MDKNETTKNLIQISVDDIVFDKNLYPRFGQDDETIERYLPAIGLFPPIVVARGRILVDGFHRLQAYKREGIKTIKAEDLGDMPDIEILKQAIRRNAGHGRQLDLKDKRHNADRLYKALSGSPKERYAEIASLLSITLQTAEKYCEEARRNEKEAQREQAWDRWLDCFSEREISEQIKIPQQTINGWLTEKRQDSEIGPPPDSLQYFDIWTFAVKVDDAYFRKMEEQVLENLLSLSTTPGQIVFDPMVGTGTMIRIAKEMYRRVWAADLNPYTPTLPIHQHDITAGWPKGAPPKVHLVFLDPPRWQEAIGKSDKPHADLGSQTFEEFIKSWRAIVQECTAHLEKNGRLAFTIGPAETDENVAEYTFQLWRVCVDAGLLTERRIVIPYEKEASDVQMESAYKEGKLLNGYRDLLIMCKTK
jgi:hypothetical protein